MFLKIKQICTWFWLLIKIFLKNGHSLENGREKVLYMIIKDINIPGLKLLSSKIKDLVNLGPLKTEFLKKNLG